MPKDPEGKPSPDGKIVMIALGMSNARAELDRFGDIANPVKSGAVELIHGGGVAGDTYENSPVLLWGPYLWANGTEPRRDGLTWECKDFIEDGIHPTDSGLQKVAQMMLDFFSNDPLTREWFSGSG